MNDLELLPAERAALAELLESDARVYLRHVEPLQKRWRGFLALVEAIHHLPPGSVDLDKERGTLIVKEPVS